MQSAAHISVLLPWQSFVNPQTKMANGFKAVMAKLVGIRQGTTHFVDCSEVFPIPVPAVKSGQRKPTSFLLDGS